MKPAEIERSGSARMPTAFGDFIITAYEDADGKEHLAVRLGDLTGPPPLVRIHSECLTGDVFGSLRCDCGDQLHTALRYISAEGRGLLLYLRQEGRGIGLNNKVRAYALQDMGMDTVQANLHLGLPADARDYAHAAAMLRDQGVDAVRLATNNPRKVQALEAHGVRVVERVAYPTLSRPENHAYLETKASKLGHLFDELVHPHATEARAESRVREDQGQLITVLRARLQARTASSNSRTMPLVTLSYAQSLDGSIATRPGRPLQLSNVRSQTLTHELRSLHDAVLVGINTVISDDPRLTTRLVQGKSAQPVVLDSRLRLPLRAKLLHPPCVPPIIATTKRASVARESRLRQAGARVLRLPTQRNGLVDLRALLRKLYALGIRTLMVEGGGQVITDFLACQLVDQMVVTISPQIVGGFNAVTPFVPKMRSGRSRLTAVSYYTFEGDLVVCANVEKAEASSPRAAKRAAGARGRG